MSNLINYNDGEIEVAISIKEDTIWLSQKQIAELFDKDVRTVNDHIKAIYKEAELLENSTIRKFRIVQKEGDREVARDISHYNLDMIISVGYRVNSKKATKFRQWATTILKEYITQGYAINTHKITEHRLTNLENDMQFVKSKIKNDELQINQGIFYNGQIYDAYAFVNDLLKSAKSEVTLCDNYIDDTIFTLCSKYPKIKFTIYTHTINKSLKLDYEKYKKQYENIELKETKEFHDRFLIIDNNEIYHLGASLKDLGNKVFAFSELNIDVLNIMEKLR
ncbi:RhuM family protein [Aliarcobacter cibarius]|uniref:Virulence RhuM family protein n=1 Tax=Aliarcobacter cibarius TaxID=255507 RepID=A0ABY2V7I8_9BACT|nr:RhuM family protein [Aliarcobacter cibarius]TLT01326.1 virulence RhuM family protein [Aliarcobacter cibarius]TLT01731.1 virulence RhuM family protein [Aliarcobacter cibarius]